MSASDYLEGLESEGHLSENGEYRLEVLRQLERIAIAVEALVQIQREAAAQGEPK